MTHIKNQKAWCLRSDARVPQTRQSGLVSPVKMRCAPDGVRGHESLSGSESPCHSIVCGGTGTAGAEYVCFTL